MTIFSPIRRLLTWTNAAKQTTGRAAFELVDFAPQQDIVHEETAALFESIVKPNNFSNDLLRVV